MKFIKITRNTAAASILAAVLSACTAVSTVNADGSIEKPVWPQWDKVTFDNHRGIFPNLDNLRQVQAGMTKDQLYYLLGRPHYNETWRPAEWNYLFYFRTPGQGTDGITTCQYKVLFDKNMIVRNFYWRAIDPQNGVCPTDKPVAQRYALSADALFAFDRSGIKDLNEKGQRQLNDLAAKLKNFDTLKQITIVGHTDYLGSDAYNLRLSRERAATVRQYLIEQGLPAAKIRAGGAGEAQPVKQCTDTGDRAALIACLQPNRRVEVSVEGSDIR